MKTIAHLLLTLLLAWSLHAAAQQPLPSEVLQANSRGLELYNNGQYDEAIASFNKAITLFKENGINDPNFNAMLIGNIALCYKRLENYDEAIKWHKEALDIYKKAFGTEDPDYATSLNDLALCYQAQGNYYKAIKLRIEALAIQKKAFGPEPPDYATSLNNLALCYHAQGNYSEAIKLIKEALEINKKALGTEHPDYAESLNNLADCYWTQENYTEAGKLYKEVLEIYKKVFGTEHPDYAGSLKNLAACYWTQGNYTEAIKLNKEALKIYKKVLGTEDPDYTELLNNLATRYWTQGNYAEAIKLNKEALEIFKKALGTEHPSYATSLSNLALCYSDQGNYAEAAKLHKKTIEIFKKTLGTEHPRYAMSLSNLAECYREQGNYTEAIKLHKEALEIRKKTLGTEHPSYATSLNNLAVCYQDQGNYAEAAKLHKEAIEILMKALGAEHPDYATSLNNLAVCYHAQGNYDEAIKLNKEALAIHKKALGAEHPSYATSLNNLAVCYSEQGNYDEAIKLDKEAIETLKKVQGAEHPSYAMSLNNLAVCYHKQGNYTEAIKLNKEAMKIRKKTLGTEHPVYATSLDNLAGCYWSEGNYAEAFKLLKEALEIDKKALGTEHPDYVTTLENLALIYYNTGDFGETTGYFLQAIAAKQRNLFEEFPGMTSHARGLYWDMHKNRFQTWLPRVVYRRATGEAVEALYDKGALLSKGLLLAADVEVRQLLLNSGDSAAIGKLEELQTTRAMLSKLYEKPISERYMNTDSLERIAERQEQELVAMSKAYGDMTRALKTSWRDVQKGLKDNEMAVEFITFPLNDNDSTLTVALTVKKGFKQPRMTTVFEEKQLVKYFNDKGSLNLDEYTRDDVSRLVWGPLAGELQGVERIYFAPSGALHGIALEHMPGVKAELVRVSSTREVALRGERTADRDAVLYGGLDYNAGSEALMAYNKIHNYGNRGGAEWDPSLPDSLALRSDAVSQLRYSLREVEQVDSILKTRGVASTLHKLHEGTEESFKALSGRAPATLLLSTHGKYVPPTEAERKRNTRSHSFLMMGDNAPHAAEDRTLSRSYLVLSGGNRVFLLGSVPEGDDGILTAREIARLDLRGTRLAVLGACETALGDVSGEGVFGLQRGFKKAGVGTILMTLWPINDASAAYLTSRFFHYLEAGATTREALSRAQADVRSHPEWNHPRHWAGYILLDALQ